MKKKKIIVCYYQFPTDLFDCPTITEEVQEVINESTTKLDSSVDLLLSKMLKIVDREISDPNLIARRDQNFDWALKIIDRTEKLNKRKNRQEFTTADKIELVVNYPKEDEGISVQTN